MHEQMVWREWLAALPFMTHSSFSVVAGGSCPPWSTLPSPSACRFGHITSSLVECEQRECVAFQTKTFRSGLHFDSFSLLLPRGATDARKPDTKLTSGEDVWCLGISILGHFFKLINELLLCGTINLLGFFIITAEPLFIKVGRMSWSGIKTQLRGQSESEETGVAFPSSYISEAGPHLQKVL